MPNDEKRCDDRTCKCSDSYGICRSDSPCEKNPMQNDVKEPTTEEIVRGFRYRAELAKGYATAYVSPIDITNAADRLESQQRENHELRETLRITCENWSASSEEKNREISTLKSNLAAETARADAAVTDIEELLGQDDFIGICWACRNHDKCVGTRDVKITCIPKWRGQPQDGEEK